MSVSEDETYYVYFSDQQSGPHTVPTMRSMIRSHHLTIGAFFWKEGFADWKELFPNDPQATGSPKQLARLAYFGIKSPLDRDWVFDLIDEDEKNPSMRAKILEWQKDKFRLHPALFPPAARTKEDLPRWRMLFGSEGIYGDEFRRPNGEQILSVLEQLDRDEPGWDRKSVTQSDESFASMLAGLYPEVCKKACTF